MELDGFSLHRADSLSGEMSKAEMDAFKYLDKMNHTKTCRNDIFFTTNYKIVNSKLLELFDLWLKSWQIGK